MTIEEKAKAYDKALEIARSYHDDPNCFKHMEGTLEHIFPELKESEDDKIRKWIIGVLSTYEHDRDLRNAAIAWLEKQGEHANFRNKIQVGDRVTRNEDGVLVNLSQLNRVAKKDEKQGEQKSAWSEEDEDRLDIIFERIERGLIVNKDDIDRLKSLKDRVVPQPKQECSEENEVKINRIVACLENLNVADNDILLKDIDWLRSLRPQNMCVYNPYKAVVGSIAEMCKHYDKASHSGLRDFYDNVKVKCKDAKEYDSLYPQNHWKPSDEQYESNINFNEFLSFLDTLEVKEVDLEKEIGKYLDANNIEYGFQVKLFDFAKHFFKLGLKAQKL